MQVIPGNVTAPVGYTASGVHCGLRKNLNKKDLALILSDRPCSAAAVYTQNLVQGAPIAVTKSHIANGVLRGAICNSGNANTCNADGAEKAVAMCEAVAKELSLSPSDFAIASTGVIGQPLNLDAILKGIPSLVTTLSADGGGDAADAIMTTDLARKELAISFPVGGKEVRIGGIAKGSGMIKPNMATMLCFITTDAAIEPPVLQKALKSITDKSFNRVSVDGDTSTNDMTLVLANGAAGNSPIAEASGPDYDAFYQGLLHVCTYIAKEMARDGEGATKLVECQVKNAPSEEEAVVLAKAVIMSSLVKSAMFGADANWGRILCALGYSGAQFDPTKVDVSFISSKGSVKVCENGFGLPFSEDTAKEILSQAELVIDVDIKLGTESACAWGCDLTYDYVRINGDYRT